MTLWQVALVDLGVLALAGLGLLVALQVGWQRARARWEQELGADPRQSPTELLFSLRATTPAEVVLTALRAAQGRVAEHPMGSAPLVQWLDHLAWDPATISPPPLPRRRVVDTRVRLGPRAARPLELALPVLPAPMGYGVGVTDAAKVALAQAATVSGTAAASGEGPYLPEERAWAHRWILQASRAGWAHQRAVVALADMVEIQIGQGAEAAIGIAKGPRHLPRRLRHASDHPRTPIRIHARPPRSLAAWIRAIHRANPAVPVGVKLPASAHLEADLARLLEAGVDVITLDGAEAASANSPAVISDHFGLPTAVAVARAHRWLVAQGLRDRVSLVASGGARGAADIAKLLALGADAVAVGTSLLLAMSHGQVHRVVPAAGPAALVLAAPRIPGGGLKVGDAAEHLARWFAATREELVLIAQALGVPSLRALNPSQLVARSEEAARLFGIPYAGAPPGRPPAAWAHNLTALAAGYRRLEQILDGIGRGLGLRPPAKGGGEYGGG
ncbi:FMN-binding glutamate synthase family protein [Candidatus Hydrogenisulfobacillus filiaventi]|uniref:FMN-binding glutamate synthase family protein n=1 Tax=Candidatus Hydrogenisulfobacillus filiaventi TaxID=2707344 RepID=A0A6F8ZG00_9FIRM|nr:FMN-binding glutamate synthase family protein [Bacillota bacterium]CAB1128392.1 FMN-binding glutamate synthase family protein [Candidatus Hydrogenisulfobacillus filiaventi]